MNSLSLHSCLSSFALSLTIMMFLFSVELDQSHYLPRFYSMSSLPLLPTACNLQSSCSPHLSLTFWWALPCFSSHTAWMIETLCGQWSILLTAFLLTTPSELILFPYKYLCGLACSRPNGFQVTRLWCVLHVPYNNIRSDIILSCATHITSNKCVQQRSEW